MQVVLKTHIQHKTSRNNVQSYTNTTIAEKEATEIRNHSISDITYLLPKDSGLPSASELYNT